MGESVGLICEQKMFLTIDRRERREVFAAKTVVGFLQMDWEQLSSFHSSVGKVRWKFWGDDGLRRYLLTPGRRLWALFAVNPVSFVGFTLVETSFLWSDSGQSPRSAEKKSG